jgi:aminoglycoside phosphotransferase (APT) family kinase protein
MHQGQLQVEVATVRRLVDEQFPQWRDRPIDQVTSAGTVNAIFRIGPGLAARFPLVAQDPQELRRLLEAERDAAGELAAVSTVPVPQVLALGEPGPGYPQPWSVQTWVPGHDAVAEDPAGSLGFALDLARFIGALRAADTRGRQFEGQGRGGHLPDHDEWLEVCFGASEHLLDVPRMRAFWADARTLPEVDADVMSHGDLIPPNVLVRDGRLTGVLDGGSFGPADPALDLVAAWHLLDADQRDVLRAELGCSRTQWRRGMAWAFQQAMGLVWYYNRSNPVMSRWGRRSLERILAAAAA